MALLEDILTWSKDLPDWQRDALRRIFATDGQLVAKDLQEIRAMAEGGVGAPKPTPLSKSHIPTMGSGTSTILLGLSDLNNVNGFSNGRLNSPGFRGGWVV